MRKAFSKLSTRTGWICLLGTGVVLATGVFTYQLDIFHRDVQKVEAGKSAPLSIVVTAAATRDITRSLTVSGVLIARDEIMVGPQADGVRLEAYYVDVSDQVKAGDVLARLDRDMLETRLVQNVSQIASAAASEAQVRAAIAEAEASEIEAKAALQRASVLNKTNNISGESLQTRETAAHVASARVDAQRQNLKIAEADKAVVVAQRRELELGLARSDVKAPASGIISSRSARVGQIVAMNANPLFQIIRDGEVELEAEVSEQSLHEINPGQTVFVAASGLDKSVEGKVRLVAPTIDEATHSGKVRVALPVNSVLRPGLFAEATIETARSDGVVVPRSAVSFASDGPRVQVVHDGIVATQKVALGISDAEGIEIVDGLTAGADVVLRAGAFLRDGDRVTAVREKPGETLAFAPLVRVK